MSDDFVQLIMNDIASEEAIFKGKKITAKSLGRDNSAFEEPHLMFEITHPKNRKKVGFNIQKRLQIVHFNFN